VEETFFTKKVEQLYEVRSKQLADLLDKIDFVATTADAWSSPHRKKFIGETVHWFNEKNKRISGCLTIKRIIGSTSYLVIGRLLEKNHNDFNISGKVSMMTTDNGSNFLKSAREFSKHSGAPEFDEDQCDEEYDHVEFLDLNTIFSNLPQSSVLPTGVLPICLPPHSKCACHLSNLCCTVDLDKISDPTFNTIMKSVETKVTKLCNAQNLSDNTSDLIRKELGGLFVKKNDTRWNSGYNSKFRVHHFATTKKSELIKLMTQLKIEPFQPVEIKFLTEYLKIMKEVVDFLNIMQGESNIGMGYLLPSLFILEGKLNAFKEDPTICLCGPLVDKLTMSFSIRY
jgi:hypothetical protein